jgi:hypothetical protein
MHRFSQVSVEGTALQVCEAVEVPLENQADQSVESGWRNEKWVDVA